MDNIRACADPAYICTTTWLATVFSNTMFTNQTPLAYQTAMSTSMLACTTASAFVAIITILIVLANARTFAFTASMLLPSVLTQPSPTTFAAISFHAIMRAPETRIALAASIFSLVVRAYSLWCADRARARGRRGDDRLRRRRRAGRGRVGGSYERNDASWERHLMRQRQTRDRPLLRL